MKFFLNCLLSCLRRPAPGLLLLLLLGAASAAWAQQPAPASSAQGQTFEPLPAAYDELYSNRAAAAARPPRTTRYDLRVRDSTWTMAGHKVHALATNGGFPSPTLTFTEGDTALIYVHNASAKSISFHWHGLVIPNRYDGVPILNTVPIEPGMTHEFKLALRQHGTYWYHSHTKLNEQLGQYGALIIYPPAPPPTADHVVLLSDWTKEKPWEVLRSLKRGTEWYAIERASVQSYGKALRTGYLGTKLKQEWKRMPEMDLADVYYQADLMNGHVGEQLPALQPGETVRLRLINGSAASYFWVQFGGGQMRVVAADGVDVVPVAVDKLLIATARNLRRGGNPARRRPVRAAGYFLGHGQARAPAIRYRRRAPGSHATPNQLPGADPRYACHDGPDAQHDDGPARPPTCPPPPWCQPAPRRQWTAAWRAWAT